MGVIQQLSINCSSSLQPPYINQQTLTYIPEDKLVNMSITHTGYDCYSKVKESLGLTPISNALMPLDVNGLGMPCKIYSIHFDIMFLCLFPRNYISQQCFMVNLQRQIYNYVVCYPMVLVSGQAIDLDVLQLSR